MGYDMHGRAFAEERHALMDAALAVRGAEASRPLWEKVWEFERSTPGAYFRRAIGGMGRLRVALHTAGAAYLAEDFGLTPPNAWAGPLTGQDGPHRGLPPLRMPEWPGQSHFDDEGAPIDDVGREYERETQRILESHHPADVPGIPLYKMGDNSGWHVNKIECQAAVKLIERHLHERGFTLDSAMERAVRLRADPAFGKEAWDYIAELGDFLPFLMANAELDGFEVH